MSLAAESSVGDGADPKKGHFMNKRTLLSLTASLLVSTSALADSKVLNCTNLKNAQVGEMGQTLAPKTLCDLQTQCEGQAQLLESMSEQSQDQQEQRELRGRASIARNTGMLFNLAVLQRSLSGEEGSITPCGR